MKVTKAGIELYEKDDKLPPMNSWEEQVGYVINKQREQINMMALIIDKLQDEIDELKNAK